MSPRTNYIVKNLNNTSLRKPKKEKTWLEYWENNVGKKAQMCHCCRTSENIVGAHVKRLYLSDWYIVPLCKYCNKRNDEFTVKGELVPINLNINSILK